MKAARTLRPDDLQQPRAVYVVWELTLRCDHACAHCGSRAGPARDDELTTPEVLDVVQQIIRLQCREVTLIGGEAYLRSDVYDVVQALVAGGVRVTLQTGGRGLSAERIRRFKEAGLSAVGVSVDGPECFHDVLRASPGSYAAAMSALDMAREAGLITTANSQINRLNRNHLRETAEALAAKGVRVWRPQLTVPMGRAADHPEWILEPYQIIEVIDTLAVLQVEALTRAKESKIPLKRAFHIHAGNNVGYYGPHEALLRSTPGKSISYWRGCQAGRFTLGIESNGVVKACPSLPTAPYVGGHLRDLDLDQIWNHSEKMAFVRTRDRSELWGFCATCYYGDACMAGCSFTAHCTLGRRGNNPFCYHRAATHRRAGRRERLVRKVAASGQPYDFGRFEIIEEDCP